MKIILPWLYEFGGELLKAVSGVQVRKDQGYKVVVEKSKTCLYPNVDQILIDDVDRTTIRNIRDNEIYDRIKADHPNDQCIFPYNFQPRIDGMFSPVVPDHKFKVDVVIFPRMKSGAANWSRIAWQRVVDALNAQGLGVFAAGIERQSWDLDDVLNAWEFENPLEASIYAIKNSSARIGPITGLQVLSLMCGRRSLLLLGPGGEKGLDTKQKPNLDYLRVADHQNVGYTLVPLMNDIDAVIGALLYEIQRATKAK